MRRRRVAWGLTRGARAGKIVSALLPFGEFAMELPAGLRLSVEDRVASAEIAAIEHGLMEYNGQFIEQAPIASFGVLVRDDGGSIAAGLIADCYAGWLFIKYLWVDGRLRRGGIGRALIAEAERRAAALGCRHAWVDTFSFQAPEFYAKLGYREFGRLDYPPAHHRVFLQKSLSTE